MPIVRFVHRGAMFLVGFLAFVAISFPAVLKDEKAEHGPRTQSAALQQKIKSFAAEAAGKVAVACSLPGSSLNCDFNANARPPMQSVFKFPLAIVVLHQIEQGSLSMDQMIRFRPEDRILPHVYSPLQDRYPEGNVDVPISELLRLTVSLSDNVAAD